MMELIQCVEIVGALLLLYVAVPAFALRPWHQPLPLVALLGIATQALLGALLGAMRHPLPVHLALPLYLCVWIAVALVVRLRMKGRGGPRPDTWGDVGAYVGLGGVALVIRVIHPLETWALGQSDAYGHLQHLQQLLVHGRLLNPVYPSAYSWVLLGPTALSALDPYVVCRFGGAYFGMLLVLGSYLLMREVCGRRAGWLTGLLVAGCPLLLPLVKTGVGCFPNQLGLALLPGVLLCWGQIAARREPPWLWWLALIPLAGALVVAVPMMALTTFPVLLLAQVLVELSRRRYRVAAVWVGSLLGVATCVLLLGRMFLAKSSGASEAVGYLTGTHARASGDAAVALLRDFFSVKRWGLGSGLVTGAAGMLLALFATCAGIAFRKRQSALLLLCVWGGAMAVMTVSGFAQFTAYQREGWSLLLALALFTGFAGAAILSLLQLPALHCAVYVVVAGFSLAGLCLPPRHQLFASYAESETVRLCRCLAGSEAATRSFPAWRQLTARVPAEALCNPVLVARRFAGFADGQGDLLHALWPERAVSWVPGDALPEPTPGTSVWVVVDRPIAPPARSAGLGGVIQLAQAGARASFERRRSEGCRENQGLLAQIRERAEDGFRYVQIDFTPRLEVHIFWTERGGDVSAPQVGNEP